MRRTNLFFKVVVEHDEDESPDRIATELTRVLSKYYGVRSAELTNFTTKED
jgi:hypothetical protein